MRKRNGFNWFVVLLFATVAYFSTILVSQQMHLAQVNESQRIADKKLEKAKETNEKLRKELAELQDLNNIERLARENLGMVKEGEMPYQAARP
ncbi:MAG: cell division protein FtsL [Quinella sp. 2Q5]|nr:cell division protein FtsL [Quinella sp. 2Q5]